MDIEEKVMNIKQEIIDEARQQKDEEISRAKEKWEKKYREFQNRIAAEEEEIEQHYQQEAQKKREQIISKAILDRKRARRNSIDKCINRFLDDLRERLQGFSSQSGYLEFLAGCVKEAAELLNNQQLIINLGKEDEDLSSDLKQKLSEELPDYDFAITINENIKSGGIIVEREDGHEIVESTFETLIKHYREQIAIEIQQSVFL